MLRVGEPGRDQYNLNLTWLTHVNNADIHIDIADWHCFSQSGAIILSAIYYGI